MITCLVVGALAWTLYACVGTSTCGSETCHELSVVTLGTKLQDENDINVSALDLLASKKLGCR